jgi:putative ABC transport system substrate-binding protein
MEMVVTRRFFEELTRLGHVEGKNLAVERYSGEGRTERYAELTRHVVSSNPDLIFAIAGPLALSFKTATTTIPIVTVTADPIAIGLVPSIALRAAMSPALLSMGDWKS